MWDSNLVVFTILCVTSLFEFVTNQPILIKKLFISKEDLKLVEAGPRVLSFLYFSFCFLFLINDAYVQKKAPEEFYYFQWLVLITPITFALKALADKVQWKPD